MINRFTAFAALIASCALLLAVSVAQAQTPAPAAAPVTAASAPAASTTPHTGPLSIGIVDVEKILATSKAAQDLQKQIQGKKEAFQKEFSSKETELKTAEVNLLGEKDKVTAEQFNKDRKAYEEKIAATRQLFQKRRNALDEGLAKAMQELRRDIAQAAAQVADQHKFDIVLTRDNVLIAEKSLDITDEVLKGLDAKVTSISLKVQ